MKLNKRWIKCLFWMHEWEFATMSLEAYARTFAYCKHCGLMNYRKEYQP